MHQDNASSFILNSKTEWTFKTVVEQNHYIPDYPKTESQAKKECFLLCL